MPSFSTSFDTPRNISAFMKFRLMFLMPMNFIGILLIAIAGFIPLVLNSDDDVKSQLAVMDNDPTVMGVITSMNKTNTRENRERIYEFEYRFSVNGKEYTGKSFGSEHNLRGGIIQAGDSVEIQYSAKYPPFSRIFGKRNQQTSWLFLFFLVLFPVIGVVVYVKAVRTGLANIALLTNGVVAMGKLVRKEEIPRRSKNKTYIQYKLYFEFKTPDGKVHEILYDTNEPARLLDEGEERLVYDAVDPGKAVLVDSLPKAVREYFER